MMDFEEELEDVVEVAKKLLKCDGMIDWYTKFMSMGESVAEMVNYYVEEETSGEALEWFEGMRHNMNSGTQVLIKELELLEEYELCGKIVAKSKQLAYDGLQLEMRLERRLL